MEWLKKLKEKQMSFHKERIEYVLKNEVPQHILATKEVADALVIGEEGYSRTEAGFFFKEKLVNRLMHLCYLHGKADIDERSFQAGYEKALEVMREKLNQI